MRATTLALALSLPSFALAQPPRIVTDIPAVHSLVQMVLGDLGEASVFLGQGGNAHNYQMRPSQGAALQSADLVFWVGPEMTPWLDRAISAMNIAGKPIALLHSPGTYRRAFGDDGDHDHETEHEDEHEHEAEHEHEHEHEAEHEHEHEHEAEHEHAHDGIDPHAWLDPHNARNWLDVIAAELIAADSANAAIYRANAEASKARVNALETEIGALLAPMRERPFVVFHDAYGYFADHFGLKIAGAIAAGDAATPGAARLSELRAMLMAEGAVCAFPEAQHDPKQISMIIEGTGVRLGAMIDPEGSTLAYGATLYEGLMRNMAQSLADCLAQG